MQTIDIEDRIWRWTRNSDPSVESDPISVAWSCEHGSDYWRLTASGVIAHNGHACLIPVEGDFTLSGEFSASLNAQYDQVGLIAIKSPTTWFKGSFELDGGIYVGGVHTRETSDWSLAPAVLPAELRLTRQSGTVELSWRVAGEDWATIRQFTLEEELEVGFYSASPLGMGFRSTVKGLNLTLPG